VRFFIFFILLCFALLVKAQSVTGIVRDSLTDEPIQYASIRLLNPADSSFVIGVISAENGRFTVKPPIGKYLMDVSFVGYARTYRHIELQDKNSRLDVEVIKLQNFNQLGEIIVRPDHVPDIVVKGDTIEYNADAYKVRDDALLQDLVKRLPGIDLTADGKLMANGQIIDKLLIDGKEFFDNDIDLALKNLPASMVNKLQIFKKQSEKSELTGFKDGDTQQVMNLTIKDGYQRTLFGNAKTGYGTNHKYANKLNAQYMIDDNQYALIGNLNNVTDDFEYSGLSSQYDGITKNRNIGFNFSSQRSEKLQVSGNVKYDSEANKFEMESNTKTFIETGSRVGWQNSVSETTRRDLKLGSNLKWTPDTLTTIYARLNISTGTKDEVRRDSTRSYVENKTDTTMGSTLYQTYGTTHNLNASLSFGRKLNNKGRNISFSLNVSTTGGSSNGTNESQTVYQGILQPKLIDQELDINNSGFGLGFMASYVEPVGEGKLIQLSYNFRRENNKRDKLTYVRDGEGEYAAIDSAYTRSSRANYTTQRLNVSFQSIKEKFEYTVGFNVDPSSSSSRTSIGDSIIEPQKQSVVNFSPTFRFAYHPKSNINLDVDYYGATQQPTFKELSSDTTIIDALSKTYGNPNLKPSFQNNLNVYFQKSDFEKGSFFTISLGGSYTFNKIVDYTATDEFGNVTSTYRNVQGNWSVNGGLTFSVPLKNKKFSIDNSTYGYLMRNIGFSNGAKNITTNLTMNESFAITYKSDNIYQRFQANLTYNVTRNNISNQDNLNVTNYGFKSSTQWSLPYDFAIQNDISYTKNIGYTDNFKDSELLWNLSLSKQILREKRGTVKLQCYDIFNDRNNVIRVTSGNYISDTRTNMIPRYFLLSFNYKFNFTPKGSTPVEEDLDEIYF